MIVSKFPVLCMAQGRRANQIVSLFLVRETRFELLLHLGG